MADIYLGPSTTGATLLPPIRWTGGGNPTLGLDYAKQIEKASSLGGAPTYNFKSRHPRRWILAWEMLTQDELDLFLALNRHNGNLYLQNNWEDANWREVGIVSFEYGPHVKMGACGAVVYYDEPIYDDAFYSTDPRWSVSMTLEEVR